MFRHLSPSWPAALAASLLIPSLCSAQAPAAGLDISFGAGGKSIATLPGYTTQTFGIDRQADGKFITVGQAWAGGTTYRMALTRLNADGTLDTSFGVNGFVVYGPSSGLTYAARCLKVLADGKILVAGDASGSVVVVRFLATGALDSSFTVTSTFVGTNAQVTAMAVLSDGRCLVAANALRSGNSDNDGHVLRFTASGNVDSSFASSGRFTYGGSGEQTVAGVVVLPDGKILHAGTANGQDMYVARLTPAGSMDTTFRSTGRTLISAASGSTVEGARALCLDADGNIVVVGQSNPGAANDILVARLTSTGFLDTVFSGDGWLLTNLGGTSGLPTGLAVQADGQILISGHRPFGSPTGIALRRLLWTGDDDTSFDSDGLLTAAVGSSTSDTAGMVLEPAGGIVVAGSALESGFLRGFAAARFLPGPSLAGVEITITQDLADQTAPLATPVTLSVVASSSVPLIYSWYQNGILQVRNTSPNYGFNKVSVVNEGTWRVEVRHASSAVWSSAVTLKVLSPPVLTGQSDREVHAVIGGSAQFSANFSGRAPFTCTWFEGDTEVQSATSGLFSSTLAFSPVAAAQEGTYKLVVANADGTATSQDYILVARPDPFVDQMNPGYLVEMGGSEQLNAWAYASGDYRLQWYKNGAAITNARQSGYRIEPAALSHAGNYTLSLRSLKGSAVSTVVKVAVLNTAPVTHIAALGRKFIMPLQVAGPDLVYAWFKDDQPVLANDRISGVDSAALSFKTVEAADAGDYVCKVSGYGRAMDSGVQTLLVASTPPDLAGFTLPKAQIGLRYDYQPPLPATATGLEISNLPAGLTYSKAANRITGLPAKPGTTHVKLAAINPIGKSAALSVPLLVDALPVGMEGRFFAITGDSNGVEGWMDFTVAPGGTYSGKVQLCNLNGALSTASFKGVIAMDNGPTGVNPVPAEFTTQTTVPVTAVYSGITGPGTLILTGKTAYVEATLQVNYTLPDGGGEGQAFLSSTAMLCPWNTKQPLPEAYLGTFNLGLSPDGSGGPAGMGYAKGTVAKAGTLNLACKLPDGTGITGSGPIDSTYTGTGMTFLYGNRGRVLFQHTVGAGTTAPEYLDAFLNGGMYWSKTARPGSTGSYPNGFVVSLRVEGGGKYLPPNVPVLTGPLVMNGLEGPNNVLISVFDQTTYATLGKNHAVKFGKGLDVNPYSFTALTFNAGAGTFTGSSSYSYQEERYDVRGNPYLYTVRKPFTVQGMVVRPHDQLSSVAVGYTLVAEPDPENPFRRMIMSYPVWISPN